MRDINKPEHVEINDRRRFMRAFGAGAVVMSGVGLLGGCGGEEDSPSASPTPKPTFAAAPTPGPTYTATDADRINFLLQVQYVQAAYFLRGVFGTSLDASLTTGSGTLGTVTGGTRVTFDEAALASAMREVAYDLVEHVRTLRASVKGGDKIGHGTASAVLAGAE